MHSKVRVLLITLIMFLVSSSVPISQDSVRVNQRAQHQETVVGMWLSWGWAEADTSAKPCLILYRTNLGPAVSLSRLREGCIVAHTRSCSGNRTLTTHGPSFLRGLSESGLSLAQTIFTMWDLVSPFHSGTAHFLLQQAREKFHPNICNITRFYTEKTKHYPFTCIVVIWPIFPAWWVRNWVVLFLLRKDSTEAP